MFSKGKIYSHAKPLPTSRLLVHKISTHDPQGVCALCADLCGLKQGSAIWQSAELKEV